MVRAFSAGSSAAFSGSNRRPRARRLSRAIVDALEPRRLLAPWITTEVTGEVSDQSFDVEVADGKAYVLMHGLVILDVSGTGTPVQLGDVRVPGARGVTVSGSYAYAWMVGGPSFYIVDVSNPAAPAVVSSYLIDNFVTDAWVAGSYAYVTMSTAPGLQILDISNPSAPFLAASLALDHANAVTVAGSYAYVSATTLRGSNLTVLNVADPAHPVQVGSCHLQGGGTDVVIEGTTLYSTGYGTALVDVSNPSAPAEINWYPESGTPVELRVSNSIAYIVGGANWMEVVDFSDPLNPVFRGFLNTWGNASAIAVSGSTAYVVDGKKVLEVVDIADPANPAKTAGYTPPYVSSRVAFSGTVAYTNGGGLSLFDIQNFDAPTWVGTRETLKHANDMVVSGSYLYLSEGDAGLEVFDISTPRNPVRVGACAGADVLNAITISGSYAYVAATPATVGGGFLDIFSLANPSVPTFVGRLASTKAASDVAVSGTIAYLAAADGLHIIDVSSPANPVELSSLRTGREASSVLVAGSRVYFYAYDNSYIVDVSNPVAPVVLNTDNSICESILAISGNLAYASSDIFDVSNPTAIRHAGTYRLNPYSITLYGDSRALVVNSDVFETVRFHIGENEPATDITLSQTSIAENLPIGTVIGTLSSTCVNPSNTFTYGIIMIPGLWSGSGFTISGNQLVTNAIFNYEARSSYPILVRSTDAVGQWFEKAFTISVTDVNERPTDIGLSASSVVENQPVGTVVGTLSSTDPDAGNTFTYSLVSGTGDVDNASFTISGNQLLTAASFDYHTKSSYSIRVRSTDQGGLWFEKSFTISVTEDTSGPTVTAVYVRSSSWASGYLSFLAANLAGSSATYGYAIPTGTGSSQLQTLPWRNLNRISIAFSEDVSIAQAQFAIAGSVGSYSVSGFSYSSADHVATWSLSAVIGPDKLYIAVPGTGASPVVDLAGNVLDGEWVNPSSYSDASSSDSFPSGNGSAGGDFGFRFDVLPGDSTGGSLGKVNVADVLQTSSRSNLPVRLSTYRSDFDGNNLVNVADVLYVKSKSSVYSLPVNPLSCAR